MSRYKGSRSGRPNVSSPDTTRRPHKYLADPITAADEAGYTIEEGVVVESTERPNARRAYDEWTRFWPKTSTDYRIEEAEWAARSGPCVTIRKASAASSG